MREKLIEVLTKSKILCEDCGPHGSSYCIEAIADHLIANGVTIQRFIPVSEGLPKKMGKYLCRYVFGENADYPFEQVLWYYSNLEKPHFQHEGSMGLRVTHWMPLPQPPKEGE
jgi:hypothetical protein